MHRVAEVEPDQLAALRRLRAAFGSVEVQDVREHEPGRDPAPDQAPQDGLADEAKPPTDGGSRQPGEEPSPRR